MKVVNISALRAVVTAFASQADGQLIIGGDADRYFALTRYNTQGNPDRAPREERALLPRSAT